VNKITACSETDYAIYSIVSAVTFIDRLNPELAPQAPLTARNQGAAPDPGNHEPVMTGRPRIAAITMVFNEPVFLPIWLNHYGIEFGHDNLFVVDHGSTDGSIDPARVLNLIRQPRGVLDEDKRAAFISALHGKLLSHYDVVIYTDVDELLVIDPATEQHLADYLGRMRWDQVSPIGMNVLHRVGQEHPLDLNRPLFHQRRFLQCDPKYFKPIIARVPMRWHAGFHRSQLEPSYDPNLFLFHLRAMDIGIASARVENLNRIAFSRNALRKRHSVQFRLDQPDYLKLFFATPESRIAHAQADFAWLHHILRTRSLSDILCGKVPEAASITHVPERLRDTIALNHARTRTTHAPLAAAPDPRVLLESITQSLRESIPDPGTAGSWQLPAWLARRLSGWPPPADREIRRKP